MSSPIHIAIDAGYIEDVQEGNGFYTYLSNLLIHLKPFAKKAPYHFHLFSYAPISLPLPKTFFTLTQFPAPPRRHNHTYQQRRKYFLEYFQKAVISSPQKIDIAFFPHLEFPKNLKIFHQHNIRILVTVHDLIATHFFSPALLFSKKLRLNTLTTKGIADFFTVRRTFAHWDTLLTVSETSKQQLLSILPKKTISSLPDDSKIRVTPLGAKSLAKPQDKKGVKTEFKALLKKLPKKTFDPTHLPNLTPPLSFIDSKTLPLPHKQFILYFSGHTMRKNVVLGLRACLEVIPTLPELKDFKVVVLGHGRYWNRQIIRHRLHTQPIFLKNLSEKELSTLIASARFTLQSSLIEGFGLPVLESILSHTLPISSKIPTSVDILGEDYPMFDPYDLEEAKRVVRHFLTLSARQEKELLQKALSHAKKFTWQQTARLTHLAFSDLV